MSEDRKALHSLMRCSVSEEMIRFLTNITLQVIETVAEVEYPTPPSSPTEKEISVGNGLPPLSIFIRKLIEYTNVYTPTLLTTAVYLRRLRDILPNDATGVPSTTHRMFLACLILSAKNHNDSSPLNKHWTKYTDGLFTLEDVNLMERQLLQLLDWNMVVKEDELIHILNSLLEPLKIKEQRKNKCSSRVSIPKLYKMPRNTSVASDISSSSTLIGSTPELRRLKQPIQEGSRWNLEQLMNRHGF